MHQKLAGETESGLGCSLVRVRESEVRGTSSKMISNFVEYGRMAGAWSAEPATAVSPVDEPSLPRALAVNYNRVTAEKPNERAGVDAGRRLVFALHWAGAIKPQLEPISACPPDKSASAPLARPMSGNARLRGLLPQSPR